jgi:hypothetical protein
MQQRERRLTERLSRFFRGRANHVAAQIAPQLGEKTTAADTLRKAPDDISTARTAAILAQIDLGADWQIELLDGTAEDLAAVFEDGARQALPLPVDAAGDVLIVQ